MSRILFLQAPRVLAAAVLASGLTGVPDFKKPQEKQQSTTTTTIKPTGHPVTILSFSPDGTINFNKTKLNSILDSVKDLPVVVYSVNGSKKSGKAYLLTHLVRYLDFDSSSTEHKDKDWFSTEIPDLIPFKWFDETQELNLTKGIEIWSEPFIVQRGDKKVAVLLLDCKGLFDTYTTRRENIVLIAISHLLSSVSIYNVITRIRTDLLEHILFCSNYPRSLCADNNTDHHHRVLFVIRDFEEHDSYKWGYHSKDQCPPESQNFRDFFFNADVARLLSGDTCDARQLLELAFDHADLFLIPDPGKTFRTTGKSPEQDFKDHLKNLISLINEPAYAACKQVMEDEVTGKDLQGQVEIISQLFTNCEKIPKVEEYIQLVSPDQNDRIIQSVLNGVKKMEKEWIKENPNGVPDDQVNSFVVRLQTKSVFMFDQIMNGQENEETFKKLIDKCEEFYKQMKIQNKEKREAALGK